MKVIVVGAGIVGASIAYHLAAAGAAVTVLDAGAVGAGASAKSFGWINASFAETPAFAYCRNSCHCRRCGGKVRFGGKMKALHSTPKQQHLRRVVTRQRSLMLRGLPPWNHMLQIHHPRAFWAALKEPQTGMPSRVH